jgi:hypothetical protein
MTWRALSISPYLGEFMLSRYKEVAETVLRLHEAGGGVENKHYTDVGPPPLLLPPPLPPPPLLLLRFLQGLFENNYRTEVESPPPPPRVCVSLHPEETPCGLVRSRSSACSQRPSFESRERIVRRSVTDLIPKLAAFSPQRFAESYLSASAALLLTTIRSPAERDAGFTAFGDLAAALEEEDSDEEAGRCRFSLCLTTLCNSAARAFFQRVQC